MTIPQTIHHKKNEIQAEEFFKDEECTQDFDFTNAKNLYIELKEGDSCQLKYSERKSFFSEDLYFDKEGIFNKIITTNSTGILPVQDKERLQVIDAKEIFEDSLKTQF